MKLPEFEKANILVIGDVILDRYMNGSVNRTSPEAPVPVVLYEDEHNTIGGAANVAHNAIVLGANSKLFGLIGNDANGRTMESRCNERGISADLPVTAFPTITKTRVVANGQQIVRIDHEQPIILSTEEEAEYAKAIKLQAASVSAIILSDYGKGTLSNGMIRIIKALCAEFNLPLFIDPKGMDWEKYRGAFLLSPNLKELSEAFGNVLPNEDEAVVNAAQEIRQKLNLTHLLVTRSSKGMTLVNASGAQHFAAHAREVFDVSGAGDTVMATMVSGFASGIPLEEAVKVANLAAGIVIGKLGTATVTVQELENAWRKEANYIPHVKKEVTVFTNGCFDVLHAGHVKLLKESKALGTKLIVGLNSDRSIRNLKGSGRPINELNDRIAVLEALECVDQVIVFDDDTPERLLAEVCPDILVKGSDYKVEDVVGRQYAGKVVLVDLLPGRSTTSILNKG